MTGEVRAGIRPSTITVMVRDGFGSVAASLEALMAACADRQVAVYGLSGDLCTQELEHAGLRLRAVDEALADTDLVVTLGGDGTILRALRTFAGSRIPVFAFNLGQVGFLATAEPGADASSFAAALDGAYEVLDVPAVTIAVDGGGADLFAINDISLHRQPGTRVAELAYGVDGASVAAVRCDGLVACTPAGSTGYNLANGGPIMAWGVVGYGVSFIAPHSLTARAIVASPEDALIVDNRGESPLDVLVDGRETGVVLRPGTHATLGYRADAAVLAQLPGTTFYARLREKFGHLRG